MAARIELPWRKPPEPIENMIDNRRGFERIQQLRIHFRPELLEAVRIQDHEQVVPRGVEVVGRILEGLVKERGRQIFDHMDPGHGSGHLLRDYIGALRLAHGLRGENPKEVFVGVVAGVMHDIGCAFVPRYDEPKRAVRHAEAGALVIDELMSRSAFVNEAERISIAHGVAASTHYLRDQVVTVDGHSYTLQPYQDMVEDRPILSQWLPRWADRLDCSGAAFVGRHFLTQYHDHKDFDGTRYYDTAFPSHLRAIRRSPEDIRAAGGNRTMVEHLQMFADSQTNQSPYGKHDRGVMVELRDAQRVRLNAIIEATMDDGRSVPEREAVLAAWRSFLMRNVEPHRSTINVVEKLVGQFRQLPEEDQQRWLRGFHETMLQYAGWAQETIQWMNDALPTETMQQMPFGERMMDVIAPTQEVQEYLQAHG